GSQSIDISTAYRFHRVSIVAAGTVGCAVAEILLYEGAATLTASPGTFTLSGQAATLSRGKALTAAVGTFTLTGRAATLSAGHGFALVAATGHFVLTGIALVLAKLSGGRTARV